MTAPSSVQASAEDTAWRGGRLGDSGATERLLFGHVYEDAEIERRAFPPGTRIFCIASAGCTAFALGRDHEVVACDINPSQIAYVRRRMEGGLPETGVADHLMGFLRRLAPMAGWTRGRIDAFLEMDSVSDQVDCWRSLDTWRFRNGLDLLFSPLLLRGIYSPSLVSAVPARFGVVLRQRMERCFGLHPNRTNPYARALLRGVWDGVPEPPLASMGARIELVTADAAGYLEQCASGSFQGFSLSNILDGAEGRYRERLQRAVARAAAPDARFVLRSFGEPSSPMLGNCAGMDRSMLWGIVQVAGVQHL